MLMAMMAMATISVADMRHHRRVLIVAAPPGNPALALQRRELAGWKQKAAARDLSIVEVVGSHVAGASDTAITLRRRYRLHPNQFQAVLIGKDGHEVQRSSLPLPARVLQETIDAMPMRRAGQR